MVAGITEAVSRLSGSIQDASMTRLGGEFTMMLVCGFPRAQTPVSLHRALKPYEKKLALSLFVRPLPPALARGGKREPARLLISVYGHDRPGIVHQVARSLAQRKLSITDLETRVLRHAAKPVYLMMLEVAAPASTDVEELGVELDRLRRELGVEITLQDIEPVGL